jgi:tetratricopeptide (TPR) repeat protein
VGRTGRQLTLFAGLALCAAGPARGEEPPVPPEAVAHYRRAEALFAARDYLAAAREFERAHELKPDPVLLFNAAQAYRLGSACDKAAALYRRYLETRPDAPNRGEAEASIEECRGLAVSADGPGDGAGEPAEPTEADGAAPPPPLPSGEDRVEGGAKEAEDAVPRRFRLGIEAGWASVALGEPSDELPQQMLARLYATFVFTRGRWQLDGGLMGSWTSLPYNVAGGPVRSAHLAGGHFLGAVRYRIVAALRARLELSLGELFLSKLEDGNPWTVGMQESPDVRIGVLRSAIGIEYELHEQLSVAALLFGFAMSGRTAGLDPTYDQLFQFELFSLGFSVRL